MKHHECLQEAATGVLRHVRHQARVEANAARLHGREVSDWEIGHMQGQLLVAKYDLNADPIDMQAARNEVAFLAYRYGRS